jgi:hypothetical protein
MFGFFKKKPAKPPGPDFSAVDSQAKAEALYRKGDLEKLLLMPQEFGGEEIPENVLYVPIGVADVKAGIDSNVIRPLIEAERVRQYTVEPEYQGDSFIPIALKIRAWDPGEFTTTISIWGDALGRK